MPTLKEQYGSTLSLKERYGGTTSLKDRYGTALSPGLMRSPFLDIPSESPPMPAVSTAVSPDVQQGGGPTSLRDMFRYLPKGTAEAAVSAVSPGRASLEGRFMPHEIVGRLAANAIAGIPELAVGLPLSALEDPAGTAKGLLEFYPHVGKKLAGAFGLGVDYNKPLTESPFYRASDEETAAARHEIGQNPLDIVLAALPLLKGAKGAVRRPGRVAEAVTREPVKALEPRPIAEPAQPQVVPEAIPKQPTAPTPESMAAELGVKYDSQWPGEGGRPAYYQFTDPKSKNTSIMVADLSELPAKLEKKRAEFAGAKSTQRIPTEVQRIEEVDAPLGSVDKPHGLYTTPSNVESPHMDLGGKRHTKKVNPAARILEIPTSEGLGESGGIRALKVVVGDNVFGKKIVMVRHRAELEGFSTESLRERLKQEYPDVEWSKYFDQQEMLEGYAGLKAREAGYDAIWAPDQMEPFSEFIGLTDKAFTTKSSTLQKPAVAPKTETVQPKQPWEMTREEYTQINMPRNAMGGGAPERILARHHAIKVQQALSEGKRPPQRVVMQSHEILGAESKYPAEVLKDYPDLAKKSVTSGPVLKESTLKPTTGGGTAGSPASLSRGRMEMAMDAPKGEAVGRQQVVDHFRKSFKLPIRVGKFRKQALGIFKIEPEVVRSRQANDLNVIAHEVGHYLEKKIYGGVGKRSGLKLGKEARSELLRIGKELYGDKKPVGGYRSEGFAEYIAHWLTTDKAAEVAPEFTKYFEGSFLKNNPEVAKTLADGRALVRQWRQQGAKARVFANIDMQGKAGRSSVGERMEDFTLRANTLLADDLAPLEFVEKRIRGLGRKDRLDPMKVDPSTSPTMLARSLARSASGRAREMVLHGTFDLAGKTTGPGLREVVAPVVGDIENFLTYSYAKRAVELHKRGKDPGITLEDARHVVKELESPEFIKTHKGVTAFENRVLEHLVEAGGLSKEAAETIIAMNPSHIPLKRAIPTIRQGMGGKRMADVGSPVKRIKGSGLPVQNPFESIIQNTASIINFADKARVTRAIIDLAEKSEGAGKWVEKIPEPLQAQRIALKDIEAQLRDAGVDISKASMDEVLTVYSNAGLYKGRDNVVSLWRNGKREWFEVDKRLYGTLKAMDDVHLNATLDFLFGKPTRAIRLGATGLNAGFGLITNPIRDAFTFGLQTEFSTGSPHLIGKALTQKLRPTNEMNLLFKRSGADMSQFLGMDRRQLRKAVSEVMASDAKRRALNVVGHPIEAMKDLFSITEAGPRLAEFEAAYRKGEAKYGKGSEQALIMASNAASDVTVNFKRAGAYGKWINQITPFWNASVQGVGKFARFARDNPTKAGIKGIGALTIPTIGIWLLNKDEDWYKEAPPWMRYGFWNIETGTNKDGSPRVVRIPRPFEWGVVFSVAPEMVLDYWYTKDKAIVDDGLKYMVEQTVPVGPSSIPTTLKVPIETWANYDFFRERPIDPYFEVKYKEPEDRYGAYTSETAKFIGKQFGISPRKIDFLAQATTGGLARDLIGAGEKAAGVSPPESDVPANIPVVGRLFARTDTPEQRRQHLEYARDEREQRIKAKIKAGKTDEAREMIATWNRKYTNSEFHVPPYDQLVMEVEKAKWRKMRMGVAP